MASLWDGIVNTFNNITGVNGAEDRQNQLNTQDQLKQNAQNSYQQGANNSAAASGVLNQAATNPNQFYNSTLNTAQNAGSAIGGAATNAAVNASRGSGLNAGQAGLNAGGVGANATTQATQGAQNQLQGQTLGAAQTLGQQGLQGQQIGTWAQGNLGQQQQQSSQYGQNAGMNGLGQITGALGNAVPAAFSTILKGFGG
jgi:hypothetical protein